MGIKWLNKVKWFGLFLLLVIFSKLTFIPLFCAPPREIPIGLINDFTLNHQIPIVYQYLDEAQFDHSKFWSKEWVDDCVHRVLRKETFYYGNTDIFLYQSLDKYSIENKRVLIIGSENPIYEAVVIAYGGIPVTVDYKSISTNDNRLEIYNVEQFEKSEEQFDVILSISSIEHDGLGRYGDPINPFGDLICMQKLRSYLKDGGLFILSIPVGSDCLVYNLHRVYGPVRLPLLLDHWIVLDSFGFSQKNFSLPLGFACHQPVFCLKKK